MRTFRVKFVRKIPCGLCGEDVGTARDKSGERWAVCRVCLADARRDWLYVPPIKFKAQKTTEPRKGWVE